MSALKEFANFVTLNMANLAATYDRLLGENNSSYAALPVNSRLVQARRLIKIVAEACESGTSAPFGRLFDSRVPSASLQSDHSELPPSLIEIECLGQTLTPVVTNLEAGKFLWQMLAEARAAKIHSLRDTFTPGPNPPIASESSFHNANEEKQGQSRRAEASHVDLLDDTIAHNQLEQQIRALTKEETVQQYQQILDSITDLVLIKGPQSRIVWANKAFCDYYNMTTEQLHELIDAPFNEPDYTQQYIKDDEYVFTTGQTLDIPQEPVTRYDGEVHLFHTVKSVLRDAEGKIVMTVGVSRDVTEQKLADSERERLIIQVERRALREQTIREITERMHSATTLQELVKTTAHELGTRLSVGHAIVELGLDLSSRNGEN
jgi:PAS domain S-box-containing protein